MAQQPAASLEDRLAAIAVLQDPVRRSLYLYVVAQPEEVGRDEAATGVGIQRSLAAFHLDKLVDAGLLDVTYRRLSGRSGPGAGRPAKLYRRSPRQHDVSLPPRQYELAGSLLAQAMDQAEDRPAGVALDDVARRFGRHLGQEVASRLPRRAGRDRRITALAAALEDHGYQPYREGQALVLRNCPFHTLAGAHRDLVCGMNRSLLEGVVQAMAGIELEARPNTRPGQCCVALSTGGEES